MNNNHFVVIMAGGIGSRFWPFSRTNNPKQFHDILGIGKTMLQMTADRFKNVCPPENIYIVTNKLYKELTLTQLPFLKEEQVLLEPIGRNTAPCIAYACYKILKKNTSAVVTVTPADHVVLNEPEFEKNILEAMNEATFRDVLITLGVRPTRPDTGYGYIQFHEDNNTEFKKVKTFTEKPHLELAKKFVESGDFVWNAGIFVWNVKAFIHAFQLYLPEMAEIFKNGSNAYYTDREEAFITTAYSLCGSISIDYGIMEKSDNVYVLLTDFGWSDLGTWKSLYDISDKDQNGNVIDSNALLYDSKNMIIKTSKNKLVVVQGLDNYIVAENDHVIMICHKDQEQKVKEFLSDVKSNKEERFI